MLNFFETEKTSGTSCVPCWSLRGISTKESCGNKNLRAVVSYELVQAAQVYEIPCGFVTNCEFQTIKNSAVLCSYNF